MKINFVNILGFLKENYKTIFKGIVFLFVLYWLIYVLTPSLKISEESQKKLDEINTEIKKIEQEQLTLQNKIEEYEFQVQEVDNNIEIIKNTKIQVANDYGKKINSITKYSHTELTQFFTNRYPNLY